MVDYSAISVLVIDDEPAICSSLTAFLEDFGFQASSAESAEEALDLMQSNDYNVCIVDLRLPGMNGEDLIAQARMRHPKQRHIIYTSSITYNLPPELTEIGMRPEHVFLKPIRVLSLLVKCILELDHSVRENAD